MDHICGKRLAAALPEVIRRVVEWGELEVRPEVFESLPSASAPTIDRLLGPERRKYALRGRSRTKPGTLLKMVGEIDDPGLLRVFGAFGTHSWPSSSRRGVPGSMRGRRGESGMPGDIEQSPFRMAFKTASGTFEFTGIAYDLIKGQNPADTATFTGSFTVHFK